MEKAHSSSQALPSPTQPHFPARPLIYALLSLSVQLGPNWMGPKKPPYFPPPISPLQLPYHRGTNGREMLKTDLILILNILALFLISIGTDYWLYRSYDLPQLLAHLRQYPDVQVLCARFYDGGARGALKRCETSNRTGGSPIWRSTTHPMPQRCSSPSTAISTANATTSWVGLALLQVRPRAETVPLCRGLQSGAVASAVFAASQLSQFLRRPLISRLPQRPVHTALPFLSAHCQQKSQRAAVAEAEYGCVMLVVSAGCLLVCGAGTGAYSALHPSLSASRAAALLLAAVGLVYLSAAGVFGLKAHLISTAVQSGVGSQLWGDGDPAVLRLIRASHQTSVPPSTHPTTS